MHIALGVFESLARTAKLEADHWLRQPSPSGPVVRHPVARREATPGESIHLGAVLVRRTKATACLGSDAQDGADGENAEHRPGRQGRSDACGRTQLEAVPAEVVGPTRGAGAGCEPAAQQLVGQLGVLEQPLSRQLGAPGQMGRRPVHRLGVVLVPSIGAHPRQETRVVEQRLCSLPGVVCCTHVAI